MDLVQQVGYYHQGRVVGLGSVMAEQNSSIASAAAKIGMSVSVEKANRPKNLPQIIRKA
jgi:hypothetical protein